MLVRLMNMLRLVSRYFPLAIPLLLAGCEPLVCTAIYVPDSLRVRIVGDAWGPGEYVFEVIYGGKELRCELSVAPDASTFSGMYCADAVMDAGVTFLPTPAKVVDRHIEFELNAHPSEVQVEVVHDGETLASRKFRPEYEREEPNGKDCGFSYSGSIELALD